MLVSLGEPRGHLITTSVHRDYRLEVEYRFAGKAGLEVGALFRGDQDAPPRNGQ